MLYEQFKVVMAEIEQLDIDFKVRLDLDDVIAVLDDTGNLMVRELWRALEKSKAANEQAYGADRKVFFVSLLLHLKEGLIKPTGWDELTSCQREQEIRDMLNLLKQLVVKMHLFEVKTKKPVAESISRYRADYSDSPLSSTIMMVRQDLGCVSVRRPPIRLDDFQPLEDTIGWLESYIEELPSVRSSMHGREINVVPARGDNKAVTFFVKVMANWTMKYLGNKNYAMLAVLAHAFMQEQIHPDYDRSNVRSVFVSQKSRNHKFD